jgi:hypothetical protein
MNDDLEDLGRLFRGDPGALDTARIEAARRALWRDRRDLVLEIVAAALVVGFAVFGALSRPTPAIVAFATGIGLFLGVWIAVMVTVRLDAGSLIARSVTDFLAVGVRRRTAEIRWLRFAWTAMIVLEIAIVLWALWLRREARAVFDADPWRWWIALGSQALIVAALLVSNRRALRRAVVERDFLVDAGGRQSLDRDR